MSQRQQLERILHIDRQIRLGKYPNAERLAEQLEVSRRVVFNDRAFLLERLGAPLEFDRGRGGWYYADKTWTLPSVMITQGELLAFLLSVELARTYLGTALEGPLRHAVEKISQGLQGDVSVDLQALQSVFTVAPPPAQSVPAESLADLHRAIRERRQVKMRYYSAHRDAHSVRTVHPHHLYNHGGDWYLIAFDPKKDEDMRYFHVGRIEEMKVLEATFTRRAGFKAAEWLKHDFHVQRGKKPAEVVLRFDKKQAPYIRERRWHESQTLEELPGGALLLRFTTTGLKAVRRWVLQYGKHVEVLGPESLRWDVAKEARALAALYPDERRGKERSEEE